MTPLSERVLAEVERRLSTVPADDFGCRWNVFRARRSLTDADLPAFVVWDDGESVEEATGGGAHASMSVTLRLSVETHVPANAHTTGRRLGLAKAATKTALCVDKGRIADADGAVGVLVYTGADTNARNDGATSEAAALHFIAIYKEAYGDPARSR